MVELVETTARWSSSRWSSLSRPRPSVVERLSVVELVETTPQPSKVGADGCAGALRRRGPRASRAGAAEAARRPRADPVRARPGAGRACRRVPTARGQDPGGRARHRRLRAQPADPQSRGRPGGARPGARPRLPARHRRDGRAGARPRTSAVRAQRRACPRGRQCRLWWLRGQCPDVADPEPARGQDVRSRRFGRTQPDPRDARRLHQVPLDAQRRRGPCGRQRRRVPAGDPQVRGVRRRRPPCSAGCAPECPGGAFVSRRR